MFKTNSFANTALGTLAALAFGSALYTAAPPTLAEEQAGPVLYGEVENNVSVAGAITASTVMGGTSENNVGVLSGKVRTHAKVTNNIKVQGAITASTVMAGTARNNVGVITDASSGSGGGGGGSLIDKGINFIKGLF